MPAIGGRHSLSSFIFSLHERGTKYLPLSRPYPRFATELPAQTASLTRDISRRRGGRLPVLALPVFDEDMISMGVRVAAIEEITTLEPQRRAEIEARVANIKTRAQAVAFMEEVEAKMEAARPH